MQLGRGRDGSVLGRSTLTVMATVMDASLGAALLFFTAFHVQMAARNETTIEGCGMADPRFDLGIEANLEQVFGRNKLLWLLPVYGEGPVGDGVHWPVRDLAYDDDGAALTSVVDTLSDDSG